MKEPRIAKAVRSHAREIGAGSSANARTGGIGSSGDVAARPSTWATVSGAWATVSGERAGCVPLPVTSTCSARELSDPLGDVNAAAASDVVASARVITSSSRARYSVAEEMRAAADYWSPRWTTRSSASGTSSSGAMSLNEGARAPRCALMTATGLLCSNGARPDSISNNTTVAE